MAIDQIGRNSRSLMHPPRLYQLLILVYDWRKEKLVSFLFALEGAVLADQSDASGRSINLASDQDRAKAIRRQGDLDTQGLETMEQ